MHSKLLISQYEIVFGRPMRIGVPGDPATAQQATEQSADPQTKQSADSSASEANRTDTKSARTDPTGYYKWLSTELKRVQDAVKLNREKVKVDDKIKYDRAHKAIAPTWKVGDRVLLSESSVKPGSSKVITRQRFVGPYVIKEIVIGRPDVGQAYRLVDETTGIELRHLASNDRLKRYNTDRERFNARLPSRHGPGVGTQQQTVVGQRQTSPEEPKPIEIVSKTRLNGKLQYRVKYTDGKVYKCNWVNRPLLDHYEAKRRSRQSKAKQRFHQLQQTQYRPNQRYQNVYRC